MIILSTLTYDPIGYLELDERPDSTYQVYERRATRTATLDGLSAISDMGYTASDNTFVIKLYRPSQIIVDRLIYFVKVYPLIKLTNKDGVFIGLINNVKANINPVEFTFYVKEKIVEV